MKEKKKDHAAVLVSCVSEDSTLMTKTDICFTLSVREKFSLTIILSYGMKKEHKSHNPILKVSRRAQQNFNTDNTVSNFWYQTNTMIKLENQNLKSLLVTLAMLLLTPHLT